MPPESIRPDPAREGGLDARWAAVHKAAAVVAALAGLPAEPMGSAVRGFPVAVGHAGGQRLAVARQGVADLSVMLETGIRALLAIHGRGASPQAAARALWSEFGAARDALVALAPSERRLLG